MYPLAFPHSVVRSDAAVQQPLSESDAPLLDSLTPSPSTHSSQSSQPSGLQLPEQNVRRLRKHLKLPRLPTEAVSGLAQCSRREVLALAAHLRPVFDEAEWALDDSRRQRLLQQVAALDAAYRPDLCLMLVELAHVGVFGGEQLLWASERLGHQFNRYHADEVVRTLCTVLSLCDMLQYNNVQAVRVLAVLLHFDTPLWLPLLAFLHHTTDPVDLGNRQILAVLQRFAPLTPEALARAEMRVEQHPFAEHARYRHKIVLDALNAELRGKDVPAPRPPLSPSATLAPLGGPDEDCSKAVVVAPNDQQIYQNALRVPQFTLTNKRLATIDCVMGAVLVGIDARTNQAWCYKGLARGCNVGAQTGVSDFDRRTHTKLFTEALMARKAQSPLAPVALYETPLYYWLKMPLMYGTLSHLATTPGKYTPVILVLAMHHVLTQLTQLHQRNITHRDIKPDNILVRDAIDTTQLSDFEMAESTRITRFTGGGTPLYMAPEQRRDQRIGTWPWQVRSLKPADVFGVGMTFAQALITPREGDGNMRFTNAKTARELLTKLPEFPDDMGVDPRKLRQGLAALLRSMLCTYSSQRPSALECKATLEVLLRGVRTDKIDQDFAAFVRTYKIPQ